MHRITPFWLRIHAPRLWIEMGIGEQGGTFGYRSALPREALASGILVGWTQAIGMKRIVCPDVACGLSTACVG